MTDRKNACNTAAESVREFSDSHEKTMLWELDQTLDNGFLVRESTLSAGRFWPPHWHDYLEWELITAGRGTHTYNGKSYPISRGSATAPKDGTRRTYRSRPFETICRARPLCGNPAL
jgi:quercetin dioxygenase-like cupin family protein